MTKYIKREMADLNGCGTTQAHYRVKSYGRVPFNEFVSACAEGSTVTPADVVAVVSRVTSELARQIGRGYTVSIDGLGTFGGRLGVVNDRPLDDFEDNTEHRNSRSIAFTGISFRADKRLVTEVNDKCFSMERGGESRLQRSPYTKEQRAERARKWLSEHTLMRVADYAEINGLSHTMASTELCSLAKDPESGIISKGRRSAKVYLLGSKGQE